MAVNAFVSFFDKADGESILLRHVVDGDPGLQL